MPISECYLDWVTYSGSPEFARMLGRSTPTTFYERLVGMFDRHRRTPLLAASLVDFASFVPFNLMQSADRTGMAHSLELRCPFLSPALIHYTLSLPAEAKLQRGQAKPLLASAFAGELPPKIIKQPKRPFNPPVRGYLRRQFADLRDALTGPGTQVSSLLDRSFVAEQVDVFGSGHRDNSTFLWGLLMLETWLQNRYDSTRTRTTQTPIAA